MAVRAALDEALEHVSLSEADGGAIALARRYADELDGDGELYKLGPQLLSTLESLGMTPKARAAVAQGGTHEPTSSALDELRERRRARADRAPAVDTVATPSR